MGKIAAKSERVEGNITVTIKERGKRRRRGGIMNFKSYLWPIGLASRGALGITFAVILSLWGTGAEAHKHKAPVMELTPELLQIRDDLVKYKDPLVAVRDGYFSTVGCVQNPDGGMGVHFLNPALIGPTPDPAKPPILMYEPESDGKLQLIAVEWIIPLATGIKGRPTLFGQDFAGPMAGHEPLLPDDLHHYDLHVWLYKANPLGVFYHANPDVDCTTGATYPLREEPPRTVPHN